VATEYVTTRELDALRSEFRGEFAQLRGEMAAMEGRLRQEMGGLDAKIGGLNRSIAITSFGQMIGFGVFVLAAVRLA
jgi:hypothetical protein